MTLCGDHAAYFATSASEITSYGGETSSVSRAASAYRMPGSARTSAIARPLEVDVVQVRQAVDRAQVLEHSVADRVVDREDHHRAAARRVPADQHARDVDVVLAEDGADAADDARAVLVAADEEAALGHEVDAKRVDSGDPRLAHQHGARQLVAVHAERDQRRVAASRRRPALDDPHAAPRRDEPRVDRVDPFFGEPLQDALDRGRGEQVDVVLRELALV